MINCFGIHLNRLKIDLILNRRFLHLNLVFSSCACICKLHFKWSFKKIGRSAFSSFWKCPMKPNGRLLVGWSDGWSVSVQADGSYKYNFVISARFFCNLWIYRPSTITYCWHPKKCNSTRGGSQLSSNFHTYGDPLLLVDAVFASAAFSSSVTTKLHIEEVAAL